MSSPEELPAAEADRSPVVAHVALAGLGHLLADETVEQVVVVVGVHRRHKVNLHFQKCQKLEMKQS